MNRRPEFIEIRCNKDKSIGFIIGVSYNIIEKSYIIIVLSVKIISIGTSKIRYHVYP